MAIENCRIDNNSRRRHPVRRLGRRHHRALQRDSRLGDCGHLDRQRQPECFDNNYLEANNVAVWLSGEESGNRYLNDLISIRNNIVVAQ